MNLYSALSCSRLHLDGAQIWSVCNNGTTQPATHIQTIPAFTPQPQRVITLWLILIAPIHEGMARLSWPGWLVTYRDKYPARELNPDIVTHPSTNRARCRLTLLIEKNALPLCQTTTTRTKLVKCISNYGLRYH